MNKNIRKGANFPDMKSIFRLTRKMLIISNIITL